MGTQFVFQPYLSRGSATPCVARTIPQTSALVAAFPLSEQKRQAAIRISHEVMLRLITCLDQAEPIQAQVRSAQEALRDAGVKFNPAGTAAQLPAVLDLRQRVESFLYAAKGALRDIGGLFEPLFGKVFDHRFHKIREWLEATYGPGDHLLAVLASDSAWIERVIAMRNAVDHPGTPSTLHVDNFRLLAATPPQVAEPMWRLDDGPSTPIAGDMMIVTDNLLTLFEDVLTDGLLRLQPNGPFVIYEVPEAERDPAMPIRLRVGLARPIAGA